MNLQEEREPPTPVPPSVSAVSPRSRFWQRWEEPGIFWLAGLSFAFIALCPLLILGIQWLWTGGWAESAGILATAHLWLLLARSVGMAACVTVLAVILGVIVGFLVSRFDFPASRLLLICHAFPLFVPPFLLALGWFYLIGRSGPLGNALTDFALFSPVGAIAIMVAAFTPVVSLLVYLALGNVDPSLEEAARLVAQPSQVLWRILLPLVRPAISLGALIVFALSFAELGVPNFLRVDSYPGAVFSRLGGALFAPGEALALATPMLGVCLALLVVERRLLGRRSFSVLGMSQRQHWRIPLGNKRLPVAIGAWALVLGSLLPVGGLAWRAGLTGFAGMPVWIGSSLTNSLIEGALGATAILAIGMVLGHALARRKKLSGVFDAAGVMAFVTPAAIGGIGLTALWNRPATAAVYGSIAIVVLALVAHYGILGIRAAGVVFLQGPPQLEEAAAAFGAPYLRRMARIVLPLHLRGLAGVWLLALIFCLRDLETVVTIYPAGLEPMPVRIFTLEANGPEPVLAALALVQILMTAGILGLGGALLAVRRKAT